MLERLGHLSAARPRRTLIILLCFVVLAAVVGGPVAGQLESGDGFRTDSSESTRADEQFQRATGEDTAPGIVLLVQRSAAGLEQRAQAAADELAGLPSPHSSWTSTSSAPCGRARPASSSRTSTRRTC